MIRMQAVNKWYPSGDTKLHALKNINLEIHSGDYVSLMGPSGSGKSTLLNMIGLLDVFEDGEYWLAQHPTHELSEESRARLRREHIGFIFQSFQLIPRLTAFENVALPLVLSEVPSHERQQKVTSVLKQMDMLARAHHRPSQLSGGQLQRVAIARAIVTEPSVILADEPTGNLDQQSGHDITELLENLNRRGITLIVVTHDPALGQRARRQIRMIDGALVNS
ncbi:Lipoprotein-releasing system ATP-binding protein LolD [Saliniradius amylolyticus]|uniref:Lipoprotein-releasing system ATP-binding protein LolD n=1 Tax=Saliniradius amylolyticus TaxID=2183582 RepID=A0A2S2E679_9ALTE|nr:ABC transporter ATP-binding protein [Saliniradius amylolyticus]AWL12467.1 Lipoprotein-releasing system ATP-binding protein LolD [Saliniradius amylolyticus]